MARKKTAKKKTGKKGKDLVQVEVTTLFVPKPTQYLNTPEAAAYLQGKVGVVSEQFLHTARLGKTGTPGPEYLRLGRSIFYPVEGLNEWLLEHAEELKSGIWQWRRKKRMARLSTA